MGSIYKINKISGEYKITTIYLKKLRDALDRGEGEQVLASFQQDDDAGFATNLKFVSKLA